MLIPLHVHPVGKDDQYHLHEGRRAAGEREVGTNEILISQEHENLSEEEVFNLKSNAEEENIIEEDEDQEKI